MYKCDYCGKTAPKRAKCTLIVVKTRRKQYAYRPKVSKGTMYKRGKLVKTTKKAFMRDDRGGFGCEIVKEAKCCPSCLAKR